MVMKEFADDILQYVGDDYEKLKKLHNIKDFEIGRIEVPSTGLKIIVSLYETSSNGKNYAVEFETEKLIDQDFYNILDKSGLDRLRYDQYHLRTRLRIQSALLDIYNNKDRQKKNQVGRDLIYIKLTDGGNLLWR